MPTFRFRILFVDDEPAVRTTAGAVLEAAGYEVLTAADGMDGLHCLDEAQPDLIISDLRMPNMLLADTFFQKGDYSVADLLNKIKELVRQAPERPVQGKRNTSPIWVALNGSGQVIVTCPKCLRSFDVDPSQVNEGIHIASCSSCDNEFTFNIDQFSMPQFFGNDRGASAKPKKAKRRSARG
jgi:CheY-like chemotaxis protein